MKTSSLFDDDDEEAAVPPPSSGAAETFEAQWLRERERRLDLEVEVFELKELVRQLRQQLEQYESPLPAVAQKTLNTTTMGLFDESDSDDEDAADFGVASSSVQGIGKLDTRTEPLSEWEKLALEEKERRKLKARQRQQRTPAGRKNISRRQAAASAQAPLGGATVQQLASKVSAEDLLGVHLPSPAPAVSAAPTIAATPAHRSSFSSSSASSASSASDSSSSAFSDDEEDESVGWDDELAVPSSSSSPSPTRVSLSLSSTPAAALNARVTSASLERDSALSSEQLEAEVEAEVIAWARGRDVISMLLSAPSVFHGPLPELSADKLGGASTPRPEDVRKAYLRVVRCCHPDKQPADVAPRVRTQAAKVFSALTDAFSAYKAGNGLQ